MINKTVIKVSGLVIGLYIIGYFIFRFAWPEALSDQGLLLSVISIIVLFFGIIFLFLSKKIGKFGKPPAIKTLSPQETSERKAGAKKLILQLVYSFIVLNLVYAFQAVIRWYLRTHSGF